LIREGSLRIAFVTSIHADFDARVWKYASMMARRGDTVHLVCPWQVRDGTVRDGVTLHTFPRAQSRAVRPLWIPWHLAGKLRSLVSSVDLVHFHDIDILPYMAALSIFKPVVYDVHENYPDEMLSREWIPRILRRPLYHLVRFAQAALSRLIHNAVFVIPEIEYHFPKGALRTAIIRNYASLELLKDVAPDYLMRPHGVIFTGGQYINNGTLLYLDIAERCKSVIPEVPFYMIDRFGSTGFRNQVLELIKERGLSNIELLQNVKPPSTYACGCNCETRAKSRLRVSTWTERTESV
jgi:hypothetical protein